MEKDYEAYYLKDFIYFALKGWRKIILFALIGAILLAGVALYRNREQEVPVVSTESIEEAEVELTDEEIAAIREKLIADDTTVIGHNKRIAFLRENIGIMSEHLSNSVYLSLDPDSQPLGTFSLEIVMNNITNENDEIIEQRHLLLSLDYLRSMRSNAFYTHLGREIFSSVTGDNLRELVEVNLAADGSIEFEFTGPDQGFVRKLSTAAQEYIFLEAENQISFSYPHTLNVIDENFQTVKNPSISQERQRVESQIEKLDLELQSTIDTLDKYIEEDLETELELELELALEEKIKAQAEAEQEEVEEELAKSASVPLYTIGGLLVGIMIAVMWNFYRGASAGKLLHPADLARSIGLLYINEIFVPAEESKDKQRFASAIDRWIERRYLGAKLRDAEATEVSAEYAASVISGVSENREDSDASVYKIAALSTEDAAVQTALAAINQAAELNGGKSFELISLSDSMSEVAVIDALRATDAAIIMARPRETEMQSLLRSLEISQELKKPLLGLISVEVINN